MQQFLRQLRSNSAPDGNEGGGGGFLACGSGDFESQLQVQGGSGLLCKEGSRTLCPKMQRQGFWVAQGLG